SAKRLSLPSLATRAMGQRVPPMERSAPTRETSCEWTSAAAEETSICLRAPSDSYLLPLVPHPEQRIQSVMI
ncbi:hypothetical protein ACSTLM_00170, partial [Vibrio parahaemolyticus]